MGHARAAAPGLRVELLGPAVVWRGELARGALRVVNEQDTPQEVSARLNLAEGDVRLLVTRPDGSIRRAYSSRLVDSAARSVELGPGMALESGLGLFHAHTGPIFDEPGVYQIVAQYDAAPGETLSTPALEVEARDPKTAEETALAQLLRDRAVAVSFELGEPQTVAAQAVLASMAERFAERREGRAARLIIAAAEGAPPAIDTATADIVSAEGPLEAARTITALMSAATPNGSVVRDTLRAGLQRARSVQVSTAVAIVATEPYALRSA
jgi:hypothetical protein